MLLQIIKNEIAHFLFKSDRKRSRFDHLNKRPNANKKQLLYYIFFFKDRLRKYFHISSQRVVTVDYFVSNTVARSRDEGPVVIYILSVNLYMI